jgi:septal ring factor EnvC (AmiA/AmiB activator)
MQPTTERPNPRQREILPPQPDGKGSGIKGKLGGINSTVLVIMVAIALVASYFVPQYTAVTPTKLNTLVTSIMTTVNQVKDAQAKDASAITTLQTDVSGVKTSIAGVTSSIATASSKVDTMSSKVDSANAAVSGVQSTINDSKTKIDSLQTTVKSQDTTIQSLNSSITDLTKKISDSNALIVDLQTKVIALQTATPTTTPTTTSTTGVVTATISANVFTGASYVNFGAIAPGASQTQSFSFQVNNQTGKTLSTIQLALALQTLDVAGSNFITLPTTIPVSISSGNLGMIWTQQTTGIGYLLGYVTNASTGFASIFGSTTVSTGITTYTQSIMVTNNGTVATNSMMISPMVKVTGFTTQ